MATSITSDLSSELSPETLEKAKTELNEVPEEIDGAIKELRSNIRAAEENGETKDFEFVRLEDDAFLLRFLRAKKYRQKDATKQYLNYCKYRVKHPDIFDGLCLEKVRDVFEKQAVGVLEPRSKNGCRILLLFPGRLGLDEDPNKSMDEVVGAVFLILEKLLEDPETQVHGLMMVENFNGVGFTQLIKFQFIVRREMRKFLELFQEAYPARFKGMWAVNEPWGLDVLFAIVKLFLTQKMKDRVRFLGSDLSPLHEQVDPSRLPSDLGGTLPPFSTDYTIRLLQGKGSDVDREPGSEA